MPVPTLITELSQTAASNSPAGTESPITADNYFRAHASFIAQLQAEKAPKANAQLTGSLLFGSTSARVMSSITPAVQVEGTSAAAGSIALIVNNASTTPGYLYFGKSRAASNGGFDIVSDGDRLGGLVFCAADGVDMTSIGAMLLAFVDGTPGSSDIPGRLAFYTAADGTDSATERMRLDSSGRLLVGLTSATSGGAKLQTVDGITFPATQVASSNANTLDDYEEGTWTPALSSSGSTFSYDKQIGRYTKVGNKVTVWGAIKLNTSGNTLSGNALSITGLPFAARTADAAFQVDFSIDWVALNTAVMGMSGSILPTATFAYVNYWIVAMTTKLSCTAAILSATAGSYLSFTATYETD